MAGGTGWGWGEENKREGGRRRTKGKLWGSRRVEKIGKGKKE